MVTIPTWKTAVVAYASFLQGVTAEALPEVIPRLSEIGRQIRDPSRHAADTETTHGTGWQTPGSGASPNPAGESRATRNSAGPVLLPSRERENQCLRTYGRANRRQTTRRCLGLALQRTRHQRRPALQHSTTEADHLPCHRIEVSSDRGEDSKAERAPRFEAGRPFCIL